MFSTSNKESSWTMGDFNMDSIPELVSASSEKGEIFHIESDQKGFSGKVKSSPSLKGITHLSAFKNKEIAEKLETVGHLDSLTRTMVGNYSIEDSQSIKTFEKIWKSSTLVKK